MEISAGAVRELREKTGSGIMDCKKALAYAKGDIDKAVTFLREKGLSTAEKKASRAASEGSVYAYIHSGGKVGVLVEVNCETDFVARTEGFTSLVKDIAMHIAAMSPQYVSRKDAPADIIERERRIYAAQARESGKPANVIEKMVDGKVEKFYKETCLLEQPFVKNTEVTVEKLVIEAIAKLGENISVRRFVRFKVGEGMEKRSSDLAGEAASL
ncbi:MAG: translation elongation factor Ts [Deltaproteobacteria bacterium]|nr:translation elongation factor Ts [Deltaproteobacteria bacterium]